MFPLGRERAVFGHDGPAVAGLLDLAPACVDHGFDGKDHAGCQPIKRAGFAVVQHLRVFVKAAPNAVAAEFAHHAAIVALYKLLNGMADIAQVHAGPDLQYAVPHGLVAQAAQAARGNAGVLFATHHEHAAGVTVPAIFDHGDVDVENVAFFQRLVAGYAVANLVVDRCANRLGVGLVTGRRVIQRRRYGALLVDHVVVAELVQRVGGNARLHMRGDVVEYFCGQPTGCAHGGNASFVFDGDAHGGALSQSLWASLTDAESVHVFIMRIHQENAAQKAPVPACKDEVGC